MRLFVTGLGGYLGRAIYACAAGDVAGTVRRAPSPAGACGVHVDIRDEPALTEALDAFQPQAVIHTAFVQHGSELRSINVDGTGAVARVTGARSIRLIHVSSDAIFAGDLGRPVREDDSPDPRSDYAKSKLEAERVVARLYPAALIVRTSLIYGGERISKHERRALDPGCQFYFDEIRSPVAAPDLAAALIELADMPDLQGPLHVAGAHAVSRLEFAQLVSASRSGNPTRVRGVGRPQGHPGNVELDSSRARRALRTELRGVRDVLRPPSS